MKCLEMKIKNIKVMNAIYLNAGSLKQIMQSNVLMHNQNFVHFISFPISRSHLVFTYLQNIF